MILFDLIPGADPDERPVVRFRAIYFEGGPAPEFLPEWEETDRLAIQFAWPAPSAPPNVIGVDLGAEAGDRLGSRWVDLHAGPQPKPPELLNVLEPRRALGAIDGFFHRHADRPDGRQRRRRLTAKIAHLSPGDWRQVCKLYRLFGKSCPWRLKKYGVPEWALEEVKLA